MPSRKPRSRPQKKKVRKPFTVPLVRPRTQYPKLGQKFELKHAQPLVQEIYTRLSEIYGIPVNQLFPTHVSPATLLELREGLRKRTSEFYQQGLGQKAITGALLAEHYAMQLFKIATGIPVYDPTRHTIVTAHTWNLLAGPPRLSTYVLKVGRVSYLQHEMMHGIHNLLAPHNEMPIAVREAIADVGMPWTIASVRASPLLQRSINQFHAEFGSDGLLFLMAHTKTVKNRHDIERLHFWALEKHYLVPGKGFTRKGMNYLRRQVTQASLRETLEKLKTP